MLAVDLIAWTQHLLLSGDLAKAEPKALRYRVLAPDRAAGLAMAFKLIQAAQDRWRAINGPHLVALVRADAVFVDGKLVERPDDDHQPQAA
jgi:hypothetical protein